MTKKLLLAGFLFVLFFLASGCTLIKGTGGGIYGFGQGAAKGATEGFKDDVNFLKKADSWTKENLW